MGSRELVYARQEYELVRKEVNSERKKIILYGVGRNPKRLKPKLMDLSVRVLGETLGYEYDELAADVVAWQNDTIRDAGFFRDPKTGEVQGTGGDDMVLAYRGGGKSTWGTVVRSIWYAVRDPNVRIGICSETEELPKKFLLEIEGHLINNLDLRMMFGDFRRNSNVDNLGEAKRKTIRQRSKILREPTFQAFGVGGQSAGDHFDVLIPDDLVTFKGSRTKTVRENLSNWYDSTFGGLGMKGTLHHHLGTPYFPGDLYDRLENGRDEEKVGPLKESTLSIPAEYPKKVVKTVFGKAREIMSRVANSPTRLPLPSLDRIKAKIGRVHYGTQYLMDRSLMVGEIFNLADFGQYDPDDPGLAEFRKGWAVYCFFDLKGTKKDVGDYFCGIAIAVAPDKSRVDVIDIARFRGSKRAPMTRQRNAIVAMTKKHRATLSGIEAVQMQVAFAEEVADMEMIPAEPVTVEIDKVAKALSISPQVEAGKVHLPYEDSVLGIRMQPLTNELVQFPEGDHDDCVDAFVGAMKLAYYGGAPAAGGGVDPTEVNKQRSRLRGRYGKLRSRYS